MKINLSKKTLSIILIIILAIIVATITQSYFRRRQENIFANNLTEYLLNHKSQVNNLNVPKEYKERFEYLRNHPPIVNLRTSSNQLATPNACETIQAWFVDSVQGYYRGENTLTVADYWLIIASWAGCQFVM